MIVRYRMKGKEIEEKFDIHVEGIPDGVEFLDLTDGPVIRLKGRRNCLAWKEDKKKFGKCKVLWSYDHRLGFGAGLYDPQKESEYADSLIQALPNHLEGLTRDELRNSVGAWLGAAPVLQARGWETVPSFNDRTREDFERACKTLGI